MPEVTVRRRVGRRSGDWKYRLNRWFYRNRPRIAVVTAFIVAAILGLAAVSTLKSLSPEQPPAESAPPPS
jgi:hypothetical protein